MCGQTPRTDNTKTTLTFSVSVFAGAGAGSSSSVLTVVTPKDFNGDAMQPENRGISPWDFSEIPGVFFLAWILWGFQPFSFQGSIYSYKKSAEKLYWRKKGDLKRRFKFPKTPPHCHLEKHYRSIRLSEWMWRSRWSCGVKSRRLCLFYYVTTLRKNFHSDSIPACHCAGIELKEMAHWNTMQK